MWTKIWIVQVTSWNTSRTGCGTALTLFQNLFHYPSFVTAGLPKTIPCEKTKTKRIWKNCSPIILLHLPLFTSLQQFPLCVRTKLSRYPLISLLPEEFDWSRKAFLGRKRFTRRRFRIHLREFTVVIIIYVNPACPRRGCCREKFEDGRPSSLVYLNSKNTTLWRRKPGLFVEFVSTWWSCTSGAESVLCAAKLKDHIDLLLPITLIVLMTRMGCTRVQMYSNCIWGDGRQRDSWHVS